MSGQRIRGKIKRAGKSTGRCVKKVAWQACRALLIVSCGPCICLAILCRTGRRRGCGVNGLDYEYLKPAVPYPRERALTIPSTDWRDDQSTMDQPQSPFMTKLPLEIRRLVYEHAIGGTSIHLSTNYGALCAKPCRLADCRCGKNDNPEGKKFDFALPLLRTCRIIYSEAVEYLYSTNTFCLTTNTEEIPTINHLSHFFLPQRLTMIRSLYIRLEIDIVGWDAISSTLLNSYESNNIWNSLIKLTGLRTLHITLTYRYRQYDDYYMEAWTLKDEEFLAPVKMLTTPTDFIIILPDRRCSKNVDVGDSRCVFELPEPQPLEAS